jgi:hypothetical protein
MPVERYSDACAGRTVLVEVAQLLWLYVAVACLLEDAWSWSVVAGVVAAANASVTQCGVWPPASRGSQLPGALGMTAGGPRQPSLAQCRADDSEDWSLWTKRSDWLAVVVAELLRWSLTTD